MIRYNNPPKGAESRIQEVYKANKRRTETQHNQHKPLEFLQKLKKGRQRRIMSFPIPSKKKTQKIVPNSRRIKINPLEASPVPLQPHNPKDTVGDQQPDHPRSCPTPRPPPRR